MLELWRCRLVFESLDLVAFDRPMGLISRNRDDPDALTVFQNTKHVQMFRYAFQLNIQPLMWRFTYTPTFRKMMRLLDDILMLSQKMIKDTEDSVEKRRQAGEEVNDRSPEHCQKNKDQL